MSASEGGLDPRPRKTRDLVDLEFAHVGTHYIGFVVYFTPTPTCRKAEKAPLAMRFDGDRARRGGISSADVAKVENASELESLGSRIPVPLWVQVPPSVASIMPDGIAIGHRS